MIPRVRVIQTSSPEIYYVEIEVAPKSKYLRVMISHDEFHQFERVSHSHWPSEWTIHDLLPVNYLYTEPPPATCDHPAVCFADECFLAEEPPAPSECMCDGDFTDGTPICQQCGHARQPEMEDPT